MAAKISRVARARFVRWWRTETALEVMAEELKGFTWTTGREHAILRLADGREAIFKGGRFGIELIVDDGRPVVRVKGKMFAVRELVMHCHPEPTGPSQADFDLLQILRQNESLLVEIRGPGIVRFHRKEK